VNAQAFNRYSYVLNNALVFTDPTGLGPDTNPFDSICRWSRLCAAYVAPEKADDSNKDKDKNENGKDSSKEGQPSAVDPQSSPSPEKTGTANSKTSDEFLDKIKEIISGKDYSGNTFEQNVALCQQGSLGACAAAKAQGGESHPENPWSAVPDMGKTLSDGAKLVATTTPIGVAGKATFVGQLTAAEARALYLSRLEKILMNARDKLANGETVETVAREAVAARNALKVEVRALGPWVAARAADVRNIFVYGNRAGKTADELFSVHKTWDGVLESVGRTNQLINKLVQ
jgi:hypothetical protein